MRASRDGAVLAFKYNPDLVIEQDELTVNGLYRLATHRTGITMINREGEAREQGYHDAASPWDTIVVCADNSMDDRISNLVFDLDIIHHRPSRECLPSIVTDRNEANISKTYEEIRNWFSMYTKCSDI